MLHLATHGFFLTQNAERTERPLTLAGLALAGANAGMKGSLSAAGEDGVLYALEAQDLNLEGTERDASVGDDAALASAPATSAINISRTTSNWHASNSLMCPSGTWRAPH